jgi:hypothetical protein
MTSLAPTVSHQIMKYGLSAVSKMPATKAFPFLSEASILTFPKDLNEGEVEEESSPYDGEELFEALSYGEAS